MNRDAIANLKTVFGKLPTRGDTVEVVMKKFGVQSKYVVAMSPTTLGQS